MAIKSKNPFQSILNRHPYLSLDKRLPPTKTENGNPLPSNGQVYIFDQDFESQFTLESIQVENFKSIISSEIDVSNTSFVGGYNSSGKSTHTQLVLLLSQWLTGESLSLEGAVPLNGPLISLGDNASELMNRHISTLHELGELDSEFEVEAVFNFKLNEGDGLDKRSFIFKLTPHLESTSSFAIKEISVSDQIVSQPRLDELWDGFFFDFDYDVDFGTLKNVTYKKKYTRKLIDRTFHDDILLVKKTAVGKSIIPGESYLRNPFKDDKYISFFSESVEIDNIERYSVNSIHPYSLTISSQLNTSLGNRQPEVYVETTSALKLGIFLNVLGDLEKLRDKNLGNPQAIQDSLKKRQVSYESEKVSRETYSKCEDSKQILENVYDQVIEEFELLRNSLRGELQDPSFLKEIQATFESIHTKAVDSLEPYECFDDAFDYLVLYCLSIASYHDDTISAFKKPPLVTMGETSFFNQNNLGNFIKYSYFKKGHSFTNELIKNMRKYLSNFIISLFSESERSNHSFESFQLRIENIHIDEQLLIQSAVDSESMDLISDTGVYEKEILSGSKINLFYQKSIKGLEELLDKEADSIKSKINFMDDPDEIAQFVMEQRLEASDKIITFLLEGEVNKESKVENLIRISLLFPEYARLGRDFLNNVIIKLARIENRPKEHFDNNIHGFYLPNYRTVQFEVFDEKAEEEWKKKALDYVLLSSYVIPDSLEKEALLKNSDPIFNFRFLNSSRGYTNQSEFYGGKEVTPLGINGEFTASYLFLNGSQMIEGPDIAPYSPDNIIKKLIDQEELENKTNLKNLPYTSQTLTEHVNDWVKYIFDIEEPIEIRESSYGTYNIHMGDDLLNNVGSGISQALPIILNIIISKNKFIFLEEVEQNLHAAAQAKIADMILFYSLYNRKFMVETHSEHILNRIRLRKIQLEKRYGQQPLVNVFFVNKSELNGSIAELMNINSKGQFDSKQLSEGFFDQSQLDTLGIIKEVRDL